jgi:hypothetical protein
MSEARIAELYSALCKLHDALAFQPHTRELKREIPEQLMVMEFLDRDARVLELGGSCGRNSCIINSLLTNKARHVVIEPSPKELQSLKANRRINQLNYAVENCAISKAPLFQRGWHTFATPVPDSVPVRTCDYATIVAKYGAFDTLVIDNEGNFVPMLRDFPELMDGVHTLIIEHDFHSAEDLAYFYACMHERGMALAGTYMKTDAYAPGMQWRDGVRTDPVFVSAWKKEQVAAAARPTS